MINIVLKSHFIPLPLFMIILISLTDNHREFE